MEFRIFKLQNAIGGSTVSLKQSHKALHSGNPTNRIAKDCFTENNFKNGMH